MRLMSDEEYERAMRAARLVLREEGVDSSMVEFPSRNQRYKIGINVKEAIENPGSYDDIVLQTGDRIIIPKLNSVVKISGAVLYPNVVAYSPDMSVKDYINMAGGFVKGAMRSRRYIVHMNGTAANTKSPLYKPMPGCEIIVPQKERLERRRLSAGEIASLASSTASVATMVVTMVNLLNK